MFRVRCKPGFNRYQKVACFTDGVEDVKILSPEVQNVMHVIMIRLDDVYSALQSGDIKFKYLSIINDSKSHFEEVFTLLQKVRTCLLAICCVRYLRYCNIILY